MPPTTCKRNRPTGMIASTSDVPEGEDNMISIRKIGVVGRTYRHAKRYQEILHVLMKYGFGDLVDTLNIKEHVDIVIEKVARHEPEQVDKLSRPEL